MVYWLRLLHLGGYVAVFGSFDFAGIGFGGVCLLVGLLCGGFSIDRFLSCLFSLKCFPLLL